VTALLRPATESDLNQVVQIERACFADPWTEDDLLKCLKQRNCIGMIAENDSQVVGFMVYELHANRLHLLRIAVDPDHRRTGIGSEIINRLVGKLSVLRRKRITVDVPEESLPAQLFLASHGFRAMSFVANAYRFVRSVT
jgi:ribosomal-protein-alanine N-acetyltransferase